MNYGRHCLVYGKKYVQTSEVKDLRIGIVERNLTYREVRDFIYILFPSLKG